MKEKEKWKKVVGYNGKYEVSNYGNVRFTETKKIVNPFDNGCGYLIVSLGKDKIDKKYRVHRLVACAFIKNPKKLKYVDHIDNIKSNNFYKNLQWITQSENVLKNIKDSNRMWFYNGKRRHVNQYDVDGNFIKSWDGVVNCANHFKCDKNSIRLCCNGNIKTCKGFVFRYADKDCLLEK